MTTKNGIIKNIFIHSIDILFAAAAILIGFHFNWQAAEIAIFTIFILIILNPVSSRLIVMPALALLLAIPFLLIFKKLVMAEQAAVYAYYFLIMAAVMGICDVIRKEEKGQAESIFTSLVKKYKKLI